MSQSGPSPEWAAQTGTLKRSTRVFVLDHCLQFLESNVSEAKIDEIEARPNVEPEELNAQLQNRRRIRQLHVQLRSSTPLLRQLADSYAALPRASSSEISGKISALLAQLSHCDEGNSEEIDQLEGLVKRREADLDITKFMRQYFELLKTRVLRDLRVMCKRLFEGKLIAMHITQLGKARAALRYAFREVNRAVARRKGAGQEDLQSILNCFQDVRIREVHEVVDLCLKMATETFPMEYFLMRMNARIPVLVREMSNLRRLDVALSRFVEKVVDGSDMTQSRRSVARLISEKKGQMRTILRQHFPPKDEELARMLERFEMMFFPLREVRVQPISVDDLQRYREIAVDHAQAEGKVAKFEVAVENLRKMARRLYRTPINELPAFRTRLLRAIADTHAMAFQADDPDLGSSAIASRYRALKTKFDGLDLACRRQISVCNELEQCWKLYLEQKAIGQKLKLLFISNRTDFDESLERQMIEKAKQIGDFLDEIHLSSRGEMDETPLGTSYNRVSANYLHVYARLIKHKQTPLGRRVPYCWYFGQVRYVPDTEEKIRVGSGKEFYPAGKLKFYGCYEENRRKGQGEHYATDGLTVLRKGEWDGMNVVDMDVNLQDFEIDVRALMNKVRYPDDRLGGGGFGQVYKSTLDSGRTVAIKVIELGRQDMQEFVNEVRILCGLQHENVIEFVGFSSSPCAYVMEFCEKGSIGGLIRLVNKGEEKLTFAQKKKIVYQVAKAVQYLHSKHIFHRDLKWDNVLLTEDGTAKIIDFGLSKTVETYRVSQAQHTMELGTSWYIAPEVMNRKVRGNYTKKCDVYSFGIMMYELLYQTLKPFDALIKGEVTVPSMLSLAVRVSEDPNFRPPIRPRDLKSARYGAYLRVCKHAWEHSPEERWSFDQILAEFNRWNRRPIRKRRAARRQQ